MNGDGSNVKELKKQLKYHVDNVCVKNLTKAHYAAVILTPPTRDMVPFGDADAREEAIEYIREMLKFVNQKRKEEAEAKENNGQKKKPDAKNMDKKPTIKQKKMNQQTEQADWLFSLMQGNNDDEDENENENKREKDELDFYLEIEFKFDRDTKYEESKQLKDMGAMANSFYYLLDNPMPFYRVNSGMMPGLEECASYIFIGDAAQTKSESIFSIGRRTVTDTRSLLNPNSVDAVVGLHDWYKYKLDKQGRI